MCQDSGEQSRDLNDPFVQSCEDMPASVLLDPHMPHSRPASTLESAYLEVLMDMDIS